jgi:arylsulfatase A-like enzyme
LDLLERAPRDRPWFLQVNFTGPHDPWDVTESMATLYEDVEFPAAVGDEEFPPERHVAVRRNYSAMVENIDRCVGVYLDELERRGELTDTLVVFSSDHGEMLGDRGAWGKSVPYGPSVGVPLICAGPGVAPGARCELPTTILDLAATFLDYAGLPVPDDMDSRSLRPLLEGRTDRHRDVVTSGLRDWRLAFDGKRKLIRRGGGECEMYDLVADPWEARNLAAGTLEIPRALWDALDPPE